MREWIGYYKDILTDELSSNIALNSKGWKQSTFANEKGNIGSEGSLKRVVMDETYIKENMITYLLSDTDKYDDICKGHNESEAAQESHGHCQCDRKILRWPVY